jgi:ribosomal-protein-alanine N-acetyltransferase
MKIVTERLIVRSLKVADVSALSMLWTDPEVTHFMGGPRDYEWIHAELVKDAGDKSPPKIDLWPVVEKATGQIIGHCGLVDKEVDGQVEFDLTYVLARTAWGKGYATEVAVAIADYAFNQLGLKRIIALIDPTNTASQHVATKVGLKYEKETVRTNGKIMHIYAKCVE